MIDRVFARGLLRGHVGRCADGRARRRQRGIVARRPDRFRDAKVDDNRVADGEQDVVRLDVAMHHAVRVGVHEGLGDVTRNAQRVGHRERTLGAESVAQGRPGRQRHHVVQQLAAGVGPRVQQR